MPKVSVVIPNYCHSKFLEQRIESVLNQSFQDFELILLDDASPDDGNSRRVLEKYRNHPKVSCIEYNTQNSGSTFKQWKKGMEIARGSWIWIAESDDFCDIDILEKLMGETDNNTVIAYTSSAFVDVQGHLMQPRSKDSGSVLRYKGKDFIRKRMSCGNAIWNASSAIFRKDIAMKINPAYMNYVAAGDRLFWIEIAEFGDVVHITEEKNYFRQHSMKVSPKKKQDGTTMREDKSIYDYLVNRGFLSGLDRWRIRNRYLDSIDDEDYSDILLPLLTSYWSDQSGISRFIWKCCRSIKRW